MQTCCSSSCATGGSWGQAPAGHLPSTSYGGTLASSTHHLPVVSCSQGKRSQRAVEALRSASVGALSRRGRDHALTAQSLRKAPGSGTGFPVRCAAISTIATAQPAVVQVAVEKTPNNSRRVFADVGIAAPPHVVWGALTDYDSLSNFIPSLLVNQCLERRGNGARLMQVGAQEVALGMRFSARVVLDIHEFASGLPQDLCSKEHDENKFPHPKGPGISVGGGLRDIAFSMVEGDFQAFQGVWRIQPGLAGGDTTHLSYALFVRPQVWLPVKLIQSRIEGEVANNLTAVRRYAEQLHFKV